MRRKFVDHFNLCSYPNINFPLKTKNNFAHKLEQAGVLEFI